MKKKYPIMFYMFLMCSVLLVACKPEEKSVAVVADEASDDFASFGGSYMTATPEGYYFIQSGFLYFVTSEFSDSTVVCDNLECVHNEERENWNDYYECDAYFGHYALIDYSEDYLYIAATNSGSTTDVYKVSLDGTERFLWCEFPGDVCGFAVYDGNVYMGTEVYTSEKKKQQIVTISTDDPKQKKVIYENDEEPTRTINQMKCRNGYCYFYLYDPPAVGENMLYIRINLKNGEVEEYQAFDGWMEFGKEKNIIQIKDVKSINPYVWTEKYYSFENKIEDRVELTEDDFVSIGNRDELRNMDDEYIYFRSIQDGRDAIPEADRKISVYDYDGNKKAEISLDGFGMMHSILPGTKDYMFIMKQYTGNGQLLSDFYYVDKSQFDGGIVGAHKIHITK